MKRTRKLPGSYSDAEITKVEKDAAITGEAPRVYVRRRLRLPQVAMGNPVLTQGRKGARTQKDRKAGGPAS